MGNSGVKTPKYWKSVAIVNADHVATLAGLVLPHCDSKEVQEQLTEMLMGLNPY